MIDNILIKFLILISVLFFLPKVIYRYWKIPFPIIEVFLGIILGMVFPQYFFADDMLKILSAIGIITLFVNSGIEVDTRFISKNKRFFFENILLQLLILGIIGIILRNVFDFSYQISFLVALALVTPSAGYIFSTLKGSFRKDKAWVEAKAITGEVISLLLLVILLNVDNWVLLIMKTIVIILLIFLLPIIIREVYKRFFSKIIGTDFSFIFIIAVISAFITEFIGVHFLIGAFLAGVVSRRVMQRMVSEFDYDHMTKDRLDKIFEGFNFFALIFVPFYFFSTGLKIDLGILTWSNMMIAAILLCAVSFLRIVTTFFHRFYRFREPFFEASKIGIALLPTLVFTFVIAEILVNSFNVSQELFGILLIYGTLTAMLELILMTVINKRYS